MLFILASFRQGLSSVELLKENIQGIKKYVLGNYYKDSHIQESTPSAEPKDLNIPKNDLREDKFFRVEVKRQINALLRKFFLGRTCNMFRSVKKN